MNRPRERTFLVVIVLFLIAIVSLPVSTVLGVSVDNCKGIGIASCEIDGLDALCDKLFSNPGEICDTICRDVVSDKEKQAACVICCNNVKAQLDLGG